MTQVVQAKCPHCRQTLRIPASWLNMPMKCKHCQQVFQTKPRSTTDNVAAMASSPPAVQPVIRYTPRRRRNGLGRAITVFVLLAAVVGGAGYFVYPYVSAMLAGA